jgi:hypothetical protein
MESDPIYRSSADEWHRDVLLAKSAVEDTISKMPTPLRVEACCAGYQFWKVDDDPRHPDSLGDYTRSKAISYQSEGVASPAPSPLHCDGLGRPGDDSLPKKFNPSYRSEFSLPQA